MIELIVVLLIVVPIGWLISESQSRVWLRITLGIAAIGMSYFVAFVIGSLLRLNYNANYGSASADLVETVIANVESGNEDGLLRELKRLKEEFHPTYENEANYDKLVKSFISRMEAAPHDESTNADTTTPE